MLDAIICGGMVHGTGRPPFVADLGWKDGRITGIGRLSREATRLRLDATGLAVAPGFINAVSWGAEALWNDGRAESDLAQGVTLEVFGEGESIAPVCPASAAFFGAHYAVPFVPGWTTTAAFLQDLVARGVAVNVASRVGATTLRVAVMGSSARPATRRERDAMVALAETSLAAGAVGIGAMLYAPPGRSATAAELLQLAQVAARHDTTFAALPRCIGAGAVASVAELLDIARATKGRVDLLNLKLAGPGAVARAGRILDLCAAVRLDGGDAAISVYPFTIGATTLESCLPGDVVAQGPSAVRDRLRDAAGRDSVATRIRDDPENLFMLSDAGATVRLLSTRGAEHAPHLGRSFTEIGRLAGQHALQAMLLTCAEDTQAMATFRLQDAKALDLLMQAPFTMIASDDTVVSGSDHRSVHPRCFATFAGFLSQSVRRRLGLSLAEALDRITGLPARRLGLRAHGRLGIGHPANVVVFDPGRIDSLATFANSVQLASGVVHVVVNGVFGLRDGALTGARSGCVVGRERPTHSGAQDG